jgi:hypothetical protein
MSDQLDGDSRDIYAEGLKDGYNMALKDLNKNGIISEETVKEWKLR